MPDFRLAAVGSHNPVKLAAVRAVLSRLDESIEVIAAPAESGVPDQPWGDEQTQRGALTRARNALSVSPGADVGIGIEGGVVELADGTLRTCAWAAVVDREGRQGLGGSLAMPLPNVVARRLRAGEELAHAMDAVARVTGTGTGGGAVHILTAGQLDRQRAYEPMVLYALAPWLARDYFDSGL